MNSENWLDKMDQEVDCVEAIYQSYITKRKKNYVNCFFEGKDDYKYYGIRIKLYANATLSNTYVCGNKNKVLQVHGMINSQASTINGEVRLFFVDRDFDKDIKLPMDIYITDSYAIENFYYTDTAIREMLVSELGMDGYSSGDENDLNRALEYYREKKENFINDMVTVNAWYSLQKNKAEKDLSKWPNLSELKDCTKVIGIKDTEILKSKTPNYIKVSEKELQEEIKWLLEDAVKRMRGKHLEQYLFTVINYIIQDSNKKNNREIFSKRRKIGFTLGKDNVITILSQYAETPKSLQEYLEQMVANRYGSSIADAI